MKLLSLKSNQRTMTQESVFYFVRYRFFLLFSVEQEKGFKLKHTITQLPYCMEKRPKSTCLKLANDQSTKKETVLGFGNFNSNLIFYVLPFFLKNQWYRGFECVWFQHGGTGLWLSLFGNYNRTISWPWSSSWSAWCCMQGIPRLYSMCEETNAMRENWCKFFTRHWKEN